VQHVGVWSQLESQMCQFTASGYEGDGSPDRVDALVHGLTELFPAITSRSSTARAQQDTAIMDYNPFGYEEDRGRQYEAVME